MKLVPLNTIFKVTYGNKLDLNKMSLLADHDDEGVYFIGRSAKNNGVVATVKVIDDLKPYPAGSITVALGGAILSSFLQSRDFYTAQNVAVLQSLKPMSKNVLMYYCLAIEKNKFRYGAFGREANRTLRTLLVPATDELPSWVNEVTLPDISHVIQPFSTGNKLTLEPSKWAYFKYDQLFNIERGLGPRKKQMSSNSGSTPFITSIDSNNGLTALTSFEPTHKGNVITVNRNGSVAEAFFQAKPFCTTEDVHVFNPKFQLNKYTALFLCALIKKERYRYGYGRKWGI